MSGEITGVGLTLTTLVFVFLMLTVRADPGIMPRYEYVQYKHVLCRSPIYGCVEWGRGYPKSNVFF